MSEDAFIQLVGKHQSVIHKIVTLYCTNKEDREDLEQEVILNLWRAYPSFEERSSFGTWMYRIALNTAITMLRKRGRTAAVEEKSEDIKELPDDRDFDDSRADVALLHRSIKRLSRIDRAVIMLYLDGLSYAEIGEMLGISTSNVSVKLIRIKGKLEKMLQPHHSKGA